MPEDLPPPELLRKLLRYDPDTGRLFWRHRADAKKEWNTRYADTEALITINNDGYRQGAIYYKKCRAHRVIWAMETGAWPVEHIDHINGNPADNRIENLREATNKQNSYNRGANKNNTSGFKGVCWHKQIGKWRADIRLHGKQKHLGCFDTPEEAHMAYCKASAQYHGEFGRTQ